MAGEEGARKVCENLFRWKAFAFSDNPAEESRPGLTEWPLIVGLDPASKACNHINFGQLFQIIKRIHL